MFGTQNISGLGLGLTNLMSKVSFLPKFLLHIFVSPKVFVSPDMFLYLQIVLYQKTVCMSKLFVSPIFYLKNFI